MYRYRGECDEKGNSDRWDWNLCGIPTALTDEMLKGKKEKEKEKKKKAKQRKQLAKQERVDQDEVNKIAKQEEIAKLQEAEERNIKIVGECGFCQKSLMGIVPLDIFDRRCCSSGCVVMMRRKLTAEAAEKRFKGSK
jgi:thiamine pyrophosphate-dependent acetolactate synthase large subunit-like protein